MNATPHQHGQTADSHTHNHQHEPMNQAVDHAAHNAQAQHVDMPASKMDHAEHGGHDAHAGHGVMHEGHVNLMRNRFLVTLPLTIIVLLYSPMIQTWFNFSMPTFPGSDFIAPVLGTIIFFY